MIGLSQNYYWLVFKGSIAGSEGRNPFLDALRAVVNDLPESELLLVSSPGLAD